MEYSCYQDDSSAHSPLRKQNAYRPPVLNIDGKFRSALIVTQRWAQCALVSLVNQRQSKVIGLLLWEGPVHAGSEWRRKKNEKRERERKDERQREGSSAGAHLSQLGQEGHQSCQRKISEPRPSGPQMHRTVWPHTRHLTDWNSHDPKPQNSPLLFRCVVAVFRLNTTAGWKECLGQTEDYIQEKKGKQPTKK